MFQLDMSSKQLARDSILNQMINDIPKLMYLGQILV